MNEEEVVRTPLDRRRAETGLPRERRVRSEVRRDKARNGDWRTDTVPDAPKPSCLWNSEWALAELEHPPALETLHVCSGALPRNTHGWRVDIRPTMKPDVVADGRQLPIRSESMQAVLIDPPWSEDYARSLYNTEYPRPSHLLDEAARVTKPGGLIGLVHFLVANPPTGCKFVRVIGLTQGCGYRIRALTIYRKPAQLDLYG